MVTVCVLRIIIVPVGRFSYKITDISITFLTITMIVLLEGAGLYIFNWEHSLQLATGCTC